MSMNRDRMTEKGVRGPVDQSSSLWRETTAHELLTAEDEIRLVRAIREGDQGARDHLITANQRLVVKVASRYRGHGLALEDLVGEGNVGLLRAVQGFDPAYGVRFATYAVYWVKQAIRSALITSADTIRIPAHAVGLLVKWRRIEHRLTEDEGRRPEPGRVADQLGLSDSQRRLVALAIQARELSRLDGGDEGESSWEPTDYRDAAPEASILSTEARNCLARGLEDLDRRQRALLGLRYGLDGGAPLTLKEAGKHLGITREWARILLQRALKRLAEASGEIPEGPGAGGDEPRSRPRRRRMPRRVADTGYVPETAVPPSGLPHQRDDVEARS